MSYKKTVKTPAEERQISLIKPRRYNEILSVVNNDGSPDSIDPPLNEGEAKLFEDLVNELNEYREKDPKAAFWPRELDYEEVDTSCYSDGFIDSVSTK